MTKLSSSFQNQKYLIGVLALFGLVTLYINPIRETSVSDDWAYMIMARRLFYTGDYQVHVWSSTNLMFQVYWGDLFALIGGFSLGSLRVSTLVLAIFGLIGFYFLAKEHGLDQLQAGLITLVLLSSPLILFFTFSYMTDVPFLALLIISLFFYSKAIRLTSYIWMFLGSLIVLADIFVRPMGLALLAGLGCLWLFDKARWQRIKFYLTGAIVPTVGAFFLLFGGTLFQNESISGTINKNGEISYIKNIGTFLGDVLLWRPGVFLQYLAFFSLPLVIGFMIVSIKNPKKLLPNPKILFGLTIYILAGLVYGLFFKGNIVLMPHIPWNLWILAEYSLLSCLVTLFAIPGAILYGSIFFQRYRPFKTWLELPLQERLVDLVTIFLLAYHLLYFNLGDRYLFLLVPFCLLVVGKHLQLDLIKMRNIIIISSIIVLGLSAYWIRSYQSQAEAAWKASNSALALGVAPRYIFGPWGWYCSYNFDDLLKETPKDADYLDFFFNTWLPQREKEAEIQITDDITTLPGKNWQIVKQIPYQDGFFQEKEMLVVRKLP